jgi:hypothetical protein
VPAPGPLQRAQLAAIGSLVEIHKEVSKGRAANAVVVAHKEPLREVHHARLRKLNALADALEGRLGQDVLPRAPKQLAQQGYANRCVVPFNSFSEFNKAEGGDIWFALDETRPLACFAGIWTNWTSVRKVKEGEPSTTSSHS